MKKRMLLIVISDNINRAKLKFMLEPSYFVVEASNLRQAEILISQNMDLIDAVIISSDINHIAIINAFKGKSDRPAIIAVGYTMTEENINKICSEGVSGFVKYGINKEEMVSRFEDYFVNKFSENALRAHMVNQAKSQANTTFNEESASFGSFRIDLKKRVLCNQKGFVSDFMEKYNLKTLREIFSKLSECLVYYNKIRFIDMFSIDSIVNSINGQKEPIKLKELFNLSNHIYSLEISVTSLTDFETGSSYALILFNNFTNEYQEKKLESGIFEKEYDLIASIDVYSQNVSIQYNNGSFSTARRITSFRDLRTEIINRFCHSDGNIDLSNKIDFDTIVNNLENHDFYDIITIIKQRKMIFYRIMFRYLDEFEEQIVLYIENITGLKEIDYITGSYNYQGFLNKCFDEMYQSTNKSFTIINCCCTNYKDLFELINVDAINVFVKEFNYELRNSLLKPICIGRSSSDTFWLLAETKNVDDKVLKEFDRIPIKCDNKLFNLNVRFGVYMIPPEAINRISSSYDVDIFCERSRMVQSYLQNSPDNYAYFNQTMSEEYTKRAAILSEVPDALQRGEFEVYYQPIYDIKTKKIAAAEALLRWKHKEYGFISPSLLIPAIEANGLVSKVDKYIIKKTDKFLDLLHEKNCFVPVSVNLSRLDFFDDELVQTILDIARRNEGHEHMNFEVTESYYIEISNSINQIIGDLKETGAKILLDDFGDGFSSFRALITTDFDIIKIYKGMIDQIGINKTSEEAIKAIVNMAHSVGLKVVAEGVERDNQLKFLKKNKCDLIQGFIFSKPVPETEFYIKLLGHK